MTTRRGSRATVPRAVVAVLIVPAVLVAGLARTPAAIGATRDVVARSSPFVFVPDRLTVAVGDTVRWTMAAGEPHTVTSGTYDSGSGAIPDGRFDSGILAPGETFTVTFTATGSYPYLCLLHADSGMLGTITVVGAATPKPTPSLTPKPTPKPTPPPTPARTTTPTPSPSAPGTPSPEPTGPPVPSDTPPPAPTGTTAASVPTPAAESAAPTSSPAPPVAAPGASPPGATIDHDAGGAGALDVAGPLGLLVALAALGAGGVGILAIRRRR